MCLTSLSDAAPVALAAVTLSSSPRLIVGDLAGGPGPADRGGADGGGPADHEHAPAGPVPFPSGVDACLSCSLTLVTSYGPLATVEPSVTAARSRDLTR